MRYSTAKAFFWHPYKSMSIRLKMWGLGMRGGAIEDIGDRFTLVWGQRSYVDERLHSFILCRGNHST